MTLRSTSIERMKACSTTQAMTYNLKRLEKPVRYGKILIEGVGLPV